MNIHGLPLDMVQKHAPGRFSAFSTSVTSYGVARFQDGAWLVTLPMGHAVRGTLTAALEAAKENQAEALRRLK